MGGMEKLYFKVLARFENEELFPKMVQLAEAAGELNYEKVKNIIHNLKTTGGSVGASHIHYICYYMQAHYVE